MSLFSSAGFKPTVTTGSLISHAALIGTLLSGWLLFESLQNHQLTLELVQGQTRVESLRATADKLKTSVQAQQERLATADKLANSIGPAILRDLVILSAENRKSPVAALLTKHGIEPPKSSPASHSP
jgi:hypothetical protein